MPAISVIVPVYMAERFLTRCTDSVLGQDFTDFELILIDDGSPDGSGALCDEIAAGDARVRVLHTPNGGVSAARNAGLREATGDYIAFVDADDWLGATALGVLHHTLVAAGADTAGCGYFAVMPSGETRQERPALPAGVHGGAEIRSGIVERLTGDRLGRDALDGYVWRFLYSRALIERHAIQFTGTYLEDELFLLEYFWYATSLAVTVEPLYYYYQNPRSVTRRYSSEFAQTFRGFVSAKTDLVDRLGVDYPGWEHSTNWAGLLIAIGIEYAPENPASSKEKRERVRSLTELPEMARAISALEPVGLGPNKQLVASLVRRRWLGLLGLTYELRNAGKDMRS